MKYEYKSTGFRAVLCTGNRANIKVHISLGKSHTNPIADQLDTFSCLDVMGTVFQKSCSSIYFRASRQRSWKYIGDHVKAAIESILGRTVTMNEKSIELAQTTA